MQDENIEKARKAYITQKEGYGDAETFGTAIGYVVAFYLIAQTLEELPLGPVYAAWTGLGIALTAVVGAAFWKEGVNAKKIIGLLLIIAGVVVLKLGV